MLPSHSYMVPVCSLFSPYVAILTPPTQLTVLEISPTSFTVTWRPPQGDAWDESTLFYLVNVTDTEGDGVVLLQHTVNGTTFQLRVPQLLPDHVHQVSVAAVSGEDIGPARIVWIKTNPLASTYVPKHFIQVISAICNAQYSTVCLNIWPKGALLRYNVALHHTMYTSIICTFAKSVSTPCGSLSTPSLIT